MIIKGAYTTVSFRAHLQPLRFLIVVLFGAVPKPALVPLPGVMGGTARVNGEGQLLEEPRALTGVDCGRSFSPDRNSGVQLGQGFSTVFLPSALVLIIMNKKDYIDIVVFIKQLESPRYPSAVLSGH